MFDDILFPSNTALQVRIQNVYPHIPLCAILNVSVGDDVSFCVSVLSEGNGQFRYLTEQSGNCLEIPNSCYSEVDRQAKELLKEALCS